jgi:hypothetical protein
VKKFIDAMIAHLINLQFCAKLAFKTEIIKDTDFFVFNLVEEIAIVEIQMQLILKDIA